MTDSLPTEPADGLICVLDPSLGAADETLSPAGVHGGLEALSTALRDDELRVIVLGGGSGAFKLRRPGGPLGASIIDAMHDWLLALHESDIPTIAAIDGEVDGFGLTLALACDTIVATPRCVLHAPRDTAALWLAARKIAPAAVSAWTLRGAPMPAARAHALGLIGELAARGPALEHALDLAAVIATRPAGQVRRLKRELGLAHAHALHEALGADRARCLHDPAFA